MKHIKRDYRSKACVRPLVWTYRVESKGQNSAFQNMVMLHIKSKGITHAATWKQIFYPQTPHRPWGGGQNV